MMTNDRRHQYERCNTSNTMTFVSTDTSLHSKRNETDKGATNTLSLSSHCISMAYCLHLLRTTLQIHNWPCTVVGVGPGAGRCTEEQESLRDVSFLWGWCMTMSCMSSKSYHIVPITSTFIPVVAPKNTPTLPDPPPQPSNRYCFFPFLLQSRCVSSARPSDGLLISQKRVWVWVLPTTSKVCAFRFGDRILCASLSSGFSNKLCGNSIYRVSTRTMYLHCLCLLKMTH